MNVMAWLWIGLSILGAIVLAAVVWLAGPLVSIGDAQPFDSAVVRILIILAILLAVGGVIARGQIRERLCEVADERGMVARGVRAHWIGSSV